MCGKNSMLRTIKRRSYARAADTRFASATPFTYAQAVCVMPFGGAQTVCVVALIGFSSVVAVAQNTNGRVIISKTTSNLLVSWPGVGTLQSTPTLTNSWQDVLEASSPHPMRPTNAQRFFRVISRWNRRANLIEA